MPDPLHDDTHWAHDRTQVAHRTHEHRKLDHRTHDNHTHDNHTLDHRTLDHRTLDHRATGPATPDPATGVSRRAVLAGLAAAGAVALAGCQGGGGETGTPQPPADVADDQCDACGMVIGEHFGPTGQVFYAEESPAGHPNPARFDSLAQCLFPYTAQKEGRGWEAETVYVTDYSSVDYDLPEREGTRYISRHTGPAAYAEADAVTLVVGSDVHGAMGPDAVPFSARADAAAFRDEWGGELRAFDDVEPGTFARE